MLIRGKLQTRIISLNVIEQPLPNDLSQAPLLGIWKDREDCQAYRKITEIAVDVVRQIEDEGHFPDADLER